MELNEQSLRKAIKFLRSMEQKQDMEAKAAAPMSYQKGVCTGSAIAFNVATDYLEELFKVNGDDE